MRIGIYCNSMVATCRGMGRYTREILRCITKLDNSNLYFLYVSKPINWDFPSNFRICLIPSNEIIAEQIYLPIAAKRDLLDVLWCPSNTFPLLLSNKIRLVVTIHDLIFMEKYNMKTSFSLRQRIGKIYRKYVILLGKKKINTCFTVSKYSATQIEEKLGISNVLITYNRIDSFYKLAKQYNIENKKDFYFTVSGDAPSKNLSLLIDTFIEFLPEEKLVIAGVSKRASIRSRESENIIFLPLGIEDEKLIEYYYQCKGFVFISLFEGFGIPLLEALVCNARIVCSNTTSIPEIISEFGIQVNPTDKKEIAKALKDVIHFKVNREKREIHINKYLRWMDTAQIVLNQLTQK